MPGVALVNGDTKQGAGISIRGFGSNQTFGTDQKVLIQVDGATRDVEELHRIGTQLFTDPFLYKEAEVIRGTVGSFEYGFNPGNDLIDLTLQYAYSDEQVDQKAVSCPASPTGDIPPCSALLGADQRYETPTIALKNTAFFRTGIAAHDLTAGIEYINRDRADAFAAPGGEDDRWAAFLVDEIAIGDAWTVTPAIRYERSELKGSTPPNDGKFSKDALMGGLSVRYAFENGLALFGSAAYTEGLPPIDDLEFPDRITTSEKSRTYELGFSFDREGVIARQDQLAVKLVYFDSELWDVTSFTGAGQASDPLDEIRTQGIEVEASYAMQNGFYMDLNATLGDGDEVDSAGLVRDWRNQAQDNLRLTVGRVFDDIYDFSWESIVADGIDTGDPGTTGSSYDVHNLRLTVAPEGAGIWQDTELRFGVENVFDEQFTPNLASRPQPGRNFKVTLARTF